MPVSLDADRIDPDAGSLDRFDNSDGAGSLSGALDVIVVVIQLGVRGCFLCQTEGFNDIAGSQFLQEDRIAKRPIFVECFIDDIPGIYFPVISASDRGDLVFEILFYAVRVVHASYEAWQLTVPDQGMGIDADIVLLRESHQLSAGPNR